MVAIALVWLIPGLHEIGKMLTETTRPSITIKNSSPLADEFYRQLSLCANERASFAFQRFCRAAPPAKRETYFTMDPQKCLHSHMPPGFTFPSRIAINFLALRASSWERTWETWLSSHEKTVSTCPLLQGIQRHNADTIFTPTWIGKRDSTGIIEIHVPHS